MNYGVILILLLYLNIRLHKHKQEIKEKCWQVPNWKVDGPVAMKKKNSPAIYQHKYLIISSHVQSESFTLS